MNPQQHQTTPLVVAYDIAQRCYVLFAYGEKEPTCSSKYPSSSSNNSDSEVKPPFPCLIETKLDSVPDHLQQYLAPYPIRPDSHHSKFHSSYRSLLSSNSGSISSPPSSGAPSCLDVQDSDIPSSPLPSESLPPSPPSNLSDAFLQQPYPPHLRYLTIVNSISAGTKQSSDIYFSIIVPLLKRFGVAHVYVATSSAQTIPNHAKSFSSSSTVLILGGDTSIAEFVNSLIDQPLSRRQRQPDSSPADDPLHLNLICIPTGSGNAISNSIGHESIAKSISRIFLGELQPLANFRVQFPEGSRFLQPNSPIPTSSTTPAMLSSIPQLGSFHTFAVVSWGFHASLVADSDSAEYRKFGVARFQKAAMTNLEREQKYVGTIRLSNNDQISAVRLNAPHSEKSTTTDIVLDTPHAYVLFTLVNELEKGYNISPDTRAPASRDLHLIRIPYMETAKFSEIVMLPYKEGAHVSNPDVSYVKLAKRTQTDDTEVLAAIITPESTDPIYQRWCLDGQIVLVPKSSASNGQEKEEKAQKEPKEQKEAEEKENKGVRIYSPTYICNGWKLFIVV